MGSLFQGTPQTATSYTTTNTETPKWLQDAIYNQIQMATNVANTPYQPYEGPTVAELSPLQQQAYQQVQANQGGDSEQSYGFDANDPNKTHSSYRLECNHL